MSIEETKNCEDACSKVKDKNHEDAHVEVEDEINGMGIKCYSSEFLNKLASNLSESCKVGKGAHGKVYKALLPNSDEQVAIKVLKIKDIVEERETFMAEVLTMSNTNHKNLIKLKGYCFKPHMKALVFEYMEKGSLDTFLYNKSDISIEWKTFYRIATEIASGLLYFHKYSNEQIIHYDIKAANVVLDNSLSPKIIDFGLAKLIKRDVKAVNLTRIRGTPCYTAPELLSHVYGSKVTNKCDVYSFGLLLFEILGKRNILVKQNEEYFPRQVWNSFHSGKLKVLFQDIGITEENREKAHILAKVALLCIHDNPDVRPSMEDVWLMLDKKTPVLREPSLPTWSWEILTSSTTSASCNRMSEDDTSGSSGSNISRSSQDPPESISSSLKDKTPGSTVSIVQQETQVLYQPIPMEELYEGTKKKFTFENGAIYEGTWKNGLRHGKGKMSWTNGNKYEGEFKDGSLDGLGKYTCEDGDWYEGAYKKGQREGKGIFSFVNGSKYEGEYKKGERDGRGTYVYKNGDKYIGEFKNDKIDGLGKFIYEDGDWYEGAFKEGYKEGKGIFFCVNGSKYEGEYKKGVRDGCGTYVYKNGDKYVGDYKNGIQEGKGELHFANGNKYIGEFKNDKIDGSGKFTYENGDWYEGAFKEGYREEKGIFSYVNGRKYEGEYKKGERDGRGTYVYKNEDKYIGDYKNGVQEGKGELHFANGNKYIGEFKEGYKEGKGIFSYVNGSKYEGEYKKGVRDGRGTYVYKNGDKYVGDYKNGIQEGKGELHFANGNKYEGDFKDGNKDGCGKFTYKNGSYHEGTYKNDFKEGRGIFVKANGEERCGEWIKGIEQ